LKPRKRRRKRRKREKKGRRGKREKNLSLLVRSKVESRKRTKKRDLYYSISFVFVKGCYRRR